MLERVIERERFYKQYHTRTKSTICNEIYGEKILQHERNTKSKCFFFLSKQLNLNVLSNGKNDFI